MKQQPKKPDYDALATALTVASFGLAFLPILLLIGADTSAVIALGTAYGGVVAVVAPLYARRKRDDDERPGGDSHD